ncbi:MAG: hypothetical protein PHO02_00810 [Candidatus Nanoarchaeia archaeon]|nr:hypothetical protein [Candidatus Nanoarchaeia archaeon]
MKAVLIRQKTHPSIPRRNPVARIEETISQYNPDLIVAPEYFLNNERRIYTREEKEGLVKRMADISGERLIVPGTILWQEDGLMRNTAVALSEGKVLAEHDKSIDGKDCVLAESYGLSPFYGKWEACMFKWKGLKVSLEICAEHMEGLQKKKGRKPNLQIVTAYGAYMNNSTMRVKNKGYAIICDGQRPRMCEVRRRSSIFDSMYEHVIDEGDYDDAYVYNLFPERR